MIDWQPVVGSSRIIAEAYLPDSETILVKFPDGVEWFYSACPPLLWREFTAGSRGQYIATVLDGKPNGRWTG